jgi:hypothetical protein
LQQHRNSLQQSRSSTGQPETVPQQSVTAPPQQIRCRSGSFRACLPSRFYHRPGTVVPVLVKSQRCSKKAEYPSRFAAFRALPSPILTTGSCTLSILQLFGHRRRPKKNTAERCNRRKVHDEVVRIECARKSAKRTWIVAPPIRNGTGLGGPERPPPLQTPTSYSVPSVSGLGDVIRHLMRSIPCVALAVVPRE